MRLAKLSMVAAVLLKKSRKFVKATVKDSKIINHLSTYVDLKTR